MMPLIGAQADEPLPVIWTIHGRVTALDAAPLRARVNSPDTGDHAETDALGYYTLGITAVTDSVWLLVSESGYKTQSREVSIVEAQEDVNFVLRMFVGPQILPKTFTSGPATANIYVLVASTVLSEDVCLEAKDLRTNAVQQLVLDPEAPRQWPSDTIFSGSIDIPADVQEGTYDVEAYAYRCSTHALLSELGDDAYLDGWYPYIVDSTAPVADQTHTPLLNVETPDGERRGLGHIRVEASASDPAGLTWLAIDAIDAAGKTQTLCGGEYRWYKRGESPISESISCEKVLLPGRYTLRLTAISFAGTTTKESTVTIVASA